MFIYDEIIECENNGAINCDWLHGNDFFLLLHFSVPAVIFTKKTLLFISQTLYWFLT